MPVRTGWPGLCDFLGVDHAQAAWHVQTRETPGSPAARNVFAFGCAERDSALEGCASRRRLSYTFVPDFSKGRRCKADLSLSSQKLIPQTPAARPQIPALPKDDTGALHFTSIMNNLQHVYPKQQMQDISTSYGFICLLHLANEKGLIIENVGGWEDLVVRRDGSAVDLEHGGD